MSPSDNQRKRRQRARAKEGLRCVQIEVGEDLARRFVVEIGWLHESRAGDFAQVASAIGQMVNAMIAKHHVTRDAKNLHRRNAGDYVRDQLNGANDVEPTRKT